MGTQLLRVGPFARRRLERRARRDAEALRSQDATPTAEFDARDTAPGDPVPGGEPTPTVAALQARANAYAHREEQRFLARSRRDLAEQRELTQALSADLVEEGRAIPVARVVAMHEGKRRKRAREAQG